MEKKQRYKCKKCGYYFTVEYKSTTKSQQLKRQALHLYIEGLSYREIGEILGVSNVSIMKWIKSYVEKIKKNHKEAAKAIDVNIFTMKNHIEYAEDSISSGLLVIELGKNKKNSYISRKTWWQEQMTRNI